MAVFFYEYLKFYLTYAKEFTCFCKLDFKLPALFLWMTLRLANLSNASNAVVNNLDASSLESDLRIFLIIVRAVLC